jgi:hypothetical protein
MISNNNYYNIYSPLYKLQDKDFESIFYDAIDNLVKFVLKNLNDNYKNYYIVGGKALELHLFKKIYNNNNNNIRSFDFDIHIKKGDNIENFVNNFLNNLNSAIINPQIILSLILKLQNYALKQNIIIDDINNKTFEFICCERKIYKLTVYSIMLKINNQTMQDYYIKKNN